MRKAVNQLPYFHRIFLFIIVCS
ncbi:OapA N-terminal domain-containing protein [Microbulbifer sp. MCCC 1A16149]